MNIKLVITEARGYSKNNPMVWICCPGCLSWLKEVKLPRLDIYGKDYIINEFPTYSKCKQYCTRCENMKNN